MKRQLTIDNSLDVFLVHGVGGILGALLTGIFVSAGLGAAGYVKSMNMGFQM